MSQYKKILLIADPAMQASPAQTRAMELARKTGATLHVCLVDYSIALASWRVADSSIMTLMIDSFMKIRLAWLQKQCADMHRSGIKAEYSAVWGRPAEQMIVSKVLELHPDLVVKDVHAIPAAARLFYAPLDWQLLRICPVPLMLVNPQASRVPKRIIATVDPMEADRGPAELNDRVLNGAMTLALQCDAELHAVYAFAYLPLPADDVVGLMATSYPRLHEDLREAHRLAFDQLMDRHSVPADRRHFIENVTIEIAIRDFANENKTDLVVMGTVYRSGLDRFIFGSTAERMLYQLNCDVLALKPEGFLVNAQHWFNATENQGINYGQDTTLAGLI